MKGRYWTVAQRHALEKELVRTHDAALFRRLQALAQVDQGWSVAEAARLVRVDRRSVYRWMDRFAAGGQPHSLLDQRGEGRPPKWNEELAGLLESALAQSPRQLGYPANSWTVPLLQAFLTVYLPGCEVSTWTVRRRLKALGYVWKRFRYILAPDPEAEKKTPDFGPNPGCARSVAGTR
jgi:transposase